VWQNRQLLAETFCNSKQVKFNEAVLRHIRQLAGTCNSKRAEYNGAVVWQNRQLLAEIFCNKRAEFNGVVVWLIT
jgi:hypothetical protein